MIDVVHSSVIMLAVAHVATLGLLAVDLRRSRPMGPFVAFVLGGAALAAAGCLSFFVGYLVARRHDLRPAGVAAWSSFVLMTVAASLWGLHFVATMP